jgi:hypothetical protein
VPEFDHTLQKTTTYPKDVICVMQYGEVAGPDVISHDRWATAKNLPVLTDEPGLIHGIDECLRWWAGER